jgi:hypothetical protein
MLFVLFWILGKDQYIIQVANNKIVQEFAENIVHQMLDDGWGFGAFVNSKGMTLCSKYPYLVLNVVFHSSPSLMRTKL